MNQEFPRAGFFKRILAIVYDLLSVVAIAMLVTVVNFLAISALEGQGWVDITGYVDHSQYLNDQWWFKLEMLLVVWFFYAWFWYDGGQTLVMRAWRLKVRSTTGKPLTFVQSGMRVIYSILGFGNFYVLFNPSTKLSLQDKLADTEVVVLSKDANREVYLRGVEAPNQDSWAEH